jgi:adenosylhomocysteine nucleosidase
MIIAIAAAHSMEFTTFRRNMGRVQKLPLEGWSHYLWQHCGNRVILLETGIGPEKAAGAFQALLKIYPRIDCMINFGAAGMINGCMAVGDAFLADETADASSGEIMKTDLHMTDAINSFMADGNLPLHRGRLLSSPKPVVSATLRARLKQRFQVGAVDMEAFALNHIAVERGIPFASLKMISDSANTLTRMEYWLNLPQVERTLGKIMHGFLEYLRAA